MEGSPKHSGVQDIQAQEVMINAISILSMIPIMMYAGQYYSQGFPGTPDDPKFGEL
ncbi:MAG: hypothetical protein R2941_21220 [Desulfobacterales bacterium]